MSIFHIFRTPFIFGSNNSDSLNGTDRSDIIYSRRGDDYVDAGAGNDLVIADRGDDTVLGGAGNDRIYGGRGRDSVEGGSGNDFIDGGRDNDTIDGGTGHDRIIGGRGADVVDGGAGSDWVDAGRDNDTLIHTYESGGCFDWYTGGRGIDQLVLNVSADDWANTAMQDELVAYLDYIDSAVNGGGEVRSGHFYFLGSLNLAVRQVETVSVYVDGVLTDPRDPGGNAPVAVDDGFAVAEDMVFTGDVSGNDTFEAGAVFTLESTPARGVLSLSGDGSFSYDPAGDFETLAAGETTVETFDYSLSDANGTTTGSVTLTVTGSNDAPVVTALTDTADEDGGTHFVSLLAGASDVDASDVLSVQNLVLSSGPDVGFALSGDVLQLDLAIFQSLALGDETVLEFTFDVTDGTATVPNTLTLTITGANDAPVVATALATAATEGDAAITLDLLDGASDIDEGAVLSVANVTGLVAGLTLSGSDLVIDASDPAFEPLNAGETQVIVVSYDVVDEHGAAVAQTATVTINGTSPANTPPVISAAVVATVAEDTAGFSVDMLANASDPDAGAVLDVANVSALPEGVTLSGSTLIVDASDPVFQSLNVGDSVDLVVSYDVVDGQGGATSQTATITVTGSNDAPVVAAALTANVAEDAAPITLDLLAGASDVDAGAVLSVVNVSALPAGVTLTGTSLEVDPSDAVFQSLAAGDSTTLTLSYDVVDEQGGSVAQTASITVTGTNDGPIEVTPINLNTSEVIAAFDISLLSGVEDVDAGDVLDVRDVVLASGDGAGVVIAGDMVTIDPTAYDYLDEGEIEVITITYTVFDLSGAELSRSAVFTVAGAGETNTPPVVSGPVLATAAEDDAGFSVDMLAGASDVDVGAVLSVANVSALPDGVSLSGDTLLVDPANAAFQSLNVGDSVVLTVTYDVVDEQGASVAQSAAITITGTNDAPVVAAALSATAAEDDAGFSVDMLAGASDVDVGAVLSVANVSALPDGVSLSGDTLLVDPANAAFQSLNVGDSVVLTVTYDVVDEQGASVAQSAAITITGTNDAPVVASALTASTDEDSAISVALLTGASDIDAGSSIAVANFTQTAGRAAGGTVTGGVVDFDPTAFQELDDGDSEDFTYSYYIVDEHGASVAQTLTITVTGVNDAPLATALSYTTDEDQSSITADLLSSASDVDAFDTLSALNIIQTAGRTVTPVIAGGMLTIDPSPFQDLALGESEVISFTYDITDGDAVITNTVDFTVEGRNDTPVVNAAVSLQVAQSDAAFSYGLPAGIITDIDASDVLTFSAELADGGGALPAWLSFDGASQTFSGTPVAADNGLIRIAVTATDPHGASATFEFWLATVDGTITGTPDKDDLTGVNGSYVIYGLEENDDQSGATFGDIYVNRAGDGFDVIEDNGSATHTDVLLLEGATPADVAISLWGSDTNDLLIRRADGGAVLLVNSLDGNAGDHIEQIAFDDGTIWTMADVRAMLLDQAQTDGNDIVTDINGFNVSRDTTLEGGSGDDLLIGLDGSDTYVFNAGDGRDVIEDNGYLDSDRVVINGYTSAQAVFSLRDGTTADVVIDLPGGDRIILRNSLLEASNDHIEEIYFADDDATFTMADLRLQFIAAQQTDGDDDISGFSVNPDEVFEGGSGNDNISGLDGSDTYIFNAGDGVDRIEDNGYLDTDVLDIRGYSSSDAVFTRDPAGTVNDLRIELPNGDEIVVVNTLSENNGDEIEEIRFDGDAAVLTMADLRAIILTQDQTAGADVITGWNFDETIEGGSGDDYLIGEDGSDLYVFNPLDGNDTISDSGYVDTDQVQFTGYSSTDAEFSIVAGTAADLLIRLPNGDTVTVLGALAGNSTQQIEEFIFDGDGVTLDIATVRAIVLAAQGTAGNDLVQGLGGVFDETLVGGSGNDSLIGRDGSDTYQFAAGDGHDTIEDSGYLDSDVIEISGYSSTDATFRGVLNDFDGYVIGLGSGDSITVRNGLGNDTGDIIEQVSFDGDGVTLSADMIWDIVQAGMETAGADIISGPNRVTTWNTGSGNDEIDGGNQVDTYEYAAGDGYDVYIDTGNNVVNITGYASTDLVQILSDPNYNNAIVLDFGGGDRIALNHTAYFTVNFAGDGVSWDSAALVAQRAGSGDAVSVVTGTGADEVFTLTTDSYVSGNNGNDTYQYSAGSGFSVVNETSSSSSSSLDVLQITGYSSTDMVVQFAPVYQGNGDGILLDFGNGDMVLLHQVLTTDYLYHGVDTITFDGDGVTLTEQDLIDTLIAQQQTAGDDGIRGYSGDQVLEGGTGNDTMSGLAGSDTYIFNLGDGDDEIEDNGAGSNDVLDIRGYASTDASFSTAPGNANDLVITLAGGDRIVLRNTLDSNYQDSIETVTFDGDGVSFNMADLRVLLVAQSQTAGDDLIIGQNVADTLTGGLGDDSIFGGDGADTYIFNAGDGSDVIEDNGSGDVDLMFINGYSSGDAMFSNVSGTPADLVVTLPGGDRIVMRNVLEENFYDGIASITFDGDATTLTMADIRAQLVAQQQTAGNDTINGFTLADTLEGGAGNDVMFGGDGSDTYIFNAGDGSDVIEDNGSGDTDLLFVNGYSSTEASFGYGPGSSTDLIVTFASGDKIQLNNVLEENFYDGIDSITFDGDGVVLTMADIRADLFAQQQTAGDDVVIGSTLDDTLEGGLGHDFVQGGNGSDTYVYTLGDGNDHIHDAGSSDTDRIEINGVLSGDVAISAEAGTPDTLVITFANGDYLTVVDTLDGDFYDSIEEIEFIDDGVIWTMPELRQSIFDQAGTAGNDTITGFAATADTLTGGQGDDFLQGGENSDTYVFNTGDGDDVIQEGGYGDTDVILFNDVASGDVTFEQLTPGNTSLVIHYGAGDSVTVISGTSAVGSYYAIEEYQFTDLTLTQADVLALI